MIEPGTEGKVSRQVAESDLASALSAPEEGSFPEVFSTSRMIALMELAAAQVLIPLLREGELSVGVTVDITHSAATAVGETVSATAVFKGQEGKLYLFDVVAHDAAGEIGRGTHRRAIITTSRLIEGAEKRKRSS